MMYVPEAFRVVDPQLIEQLVADHGFATLVSATDDGLTGTHVPLLLERRGAGDVLLGHVARANPHWRSFDGEREALAIFHGPHAYVSPSWYTSAPAVPTWNYAVVHVHGRPRVLDEAPRVRAILERLTAQHEAPGAEAWRMSQLPDDYLDRMTKALVAFELPIARIEAKLKLGQNRSPRDMRAVAERLAAKPDTGAQALAALTRRACDDAGD